MPFNRIFLIPSLLLLLIATSAQGQTWRGKVIRVMDGDTLRVEARNRRVTVRLAGVDAPEIGQPGAGQAYQRLRALADGEWVTVREQGRDCKQRVMAQVFVGGGNIGSTLVAEGLAWMSSEYSSDLGLIQQQTNARRKKLGIWRSGNPTPPWEWRRQQNPDADC